MKNLFFSLLLISFLAPALSFAAITPIAIEQDAPLRKKHFAGSVTLSGGCTISYSIDIEYTIVPPSVTSIHGSLSFSGTCTGTQTFRARANTDGDGLITSIESDSKDENVQSEEFKKLLIEKLNQERIFDDK